MAINFREFSDDYKLKNSYNSAFIFKILLAVICPFHMDIDKDADLKKYPEQICKPNADA